VCIYVYNNNNNNKQQQEKENENEVSEIIVSNSVNKVVEKLNKSYASVVVSRSDSVVEILPTVSVSTNTLEKRSSTRVRTAVDKYIPK
jgi:hypothetical protein